MKYSIEAYKQSLEALQKAEQALRETTDHLDLALAASGKVGTWSRNLIANTMHWDHHLYKIFGLNPYAQVITFEVFLTLIHPDDQESVKFIRHQALTMEGKPSFSSQYRIIRPDGNIRVIESHGRAYWDEQLQQLTHMVGIALDITEHKEAKQRLYRHQGKLAHVAKWSSMGEIASSFAHELNQPLTAIATYAELGLRQLESDDSSRESLLYYLQKIASQSERTGLIIHRIKDFAQQGKLHLEKLDLNILIQEAIELLRYEQFIIQPKIHFLAQPDLPQIQLDKIQVQQVVINLIRNAIEAMQEADIPDPAVTINVTVQNSHMLKVAIKDNGVGIPEENYVQILEPYFTTKPYGMGMGLAICRNIIESHGGRLTISPIVVGACFEFTLPLVRDAEHAA